MKKFLVALAVLLASAALIAACSSGGGGGGTTPITTKEQGAKTAATGANVANTVVNGKSGLSSMLGNQPTGPDAPKLPDTNMSKAMKKIGAKMGPRVAKAKAIFKAKKLAKAPVTETASCGDGGSMSLTYDDTNWLPFTLTFDDCKESGVWINGVMKLNCSESATSYSCTYQIGEGSTPFSEGYYNTGYTVKYEEWSALVTMNDSGVCTNADCTAANFTSTLNGSSEYEYISAAPSVDDPSYKDEMSFSNFSLSSDMEFTDTTGTLSDKLNGSMSLEFSEDDGTGMAVVFAETDSFSNLTLEYTMNSSVFTYSIDGTITVNYTPDVCGEGTYTFVTNEAVTYDFGTGLYTGGEIEINGTVVVRYTSTGDVRVSIDGGATFEDYDDATFDDLCPELSEMESSSSM